MIRVEIRGTSSAAVLKSPVSIFDRLSIANWILHYRETQQQVVKVDTFLFTTTPSNASVVVSKSNVYAGRYHCFSVKEEISEIVMYYSWTKSRSNIK